MAISETKGMGLNCGFYHGNRYEQWQQQDAYCEKSVTNYTQ